MQENRYPLSFAVGGGGGIETASLIVVPAFPKGGEKKRGKLRRHSGGPLFFSALSRKCGECIHLISDYCRKKRGGMASALAALLADPERKEGS